MGRENSARTSNDYRKLQNIRKELVAMKKDLCPDEKEKAQETEMKNFDDFQRKKHDLNQLITEIREDVERLNEMRKKLGGDGRDNLTIRIASENTERLRRATDQFNELKKIQEKDEKKKKKKLSEVDMAERRQMVMLIGQEIAALTNENARSKVIETDEEAEMRQRVEQRKKEQEEKTRARRERQRQRRKKGNKGIDIDDDDFTDVAPKSEQEQAFEQQVQLNMDEQNKILDEISKGLDDLKELANTANKQLTIQGAMLQQVDDKMDHAIGSFKAANKRLKSILEESGGMSRWCPILVCSIFLLALIGYIFNIA